MNCANHPDRERVAFCQNCGKPLCPECVRTLGASTLCEPCYTARMAAGPATGYRGAVPPQPAAEPNPGLAALLGFIPGVGAMYNEQYAKGIVHLLVFAVLVSLAHDLSIFGIFVAGWICYMVIEAHHTARARRDGTPLPNPFGLNEIADRLGFSKGWNATTPNPAPPYTAPPYTAPGAPPYATDPASYVPYTPPVSNWGAPQDSSPYGYAPIPPVPLVPPMPPFPDPNVPYVRRFPAGAMWLIGLGLFFLLANIGVIHGFPSRIFFPFLLIGVGVWLFVHRMTRTGQGFENDGTAAYHARLTRAIGSSIWVVLTGILWLLDEFNILSWGRSWPLWIIAAGIVMFFKRALYGGYAPVPGAYPGTHQGYPYQAAPVTPPATAPAEAAPTPASDDREGR